MAGGQLGLENQVLSHTPLISGVTLATSAPDPVCLSHGEAGKVRMASSLDTKLWHHQGPAPPCPVLLSWHLLCALPCVASLWSITG